LQDFGIEVTSSVRVSDGNGDSEALEEVPSVGDVDDQFVGTFVSDGAVGILSTIVVGKVAVREAGHARSVRNAIKTRRPLT